MVVQGAVPHYEDLRSGQHRRAQGNVPGTGKTRQRRALHLLATLLSCCRTCRRSERHRTGHRLPVVPAPRHHLDRRHRVIMYSPGAGRPEPADSCNLALKTEVQVTTIDAPLAVTVPIGCFSTHAPLAGRSSSTPPSAKPAPSAPANDGRVAGRRVGFTDLTDADRVALRSVGSGVSERRNRRRCRASGRGPRRVQPGGRRCAARQ